MQYKTETGKILKNIHKDFNKYDHFKGNLYLERKKITLNQWKELSQLFQSPSHTIPIKSISIYETKIDDESLKIIANSLIGNQELTTLSITRPGNLIRGGLGIEAIATLLQTNPSLTSLTLTDCNLGEKEGMLIADALAENKTLKKLDIGVNPIGSYAATRIIEAANVHAALTYLSFWNVNLDDNLEEFSKALAVNHSLTDLLLCCNQIGEQGAVTLGRHLVKNKNLKNLSIEFNKNIGPNGKQALEKAFKKNHCMDTMQLRNKTLKRTDYERIIQIEREMPAHNHANIEMTMATLYKLLNIKNNIRTIIKDYLHDFEDTIEEYVLSYVDLYQLFKKINTCEREEYLSFIHHPEIIKICSGLYFFEDFSELSHLSLINESNFKAFYLLSDNNRDVLHDLLNREKASLTTEVSDLQKNCLDLLLPNSKPFLFDLFKLLTEHTPLIRKDLILLLSLSNTNIERLHKIVSSLFNTNMLNYQTYQIAFDRITAKIPKYSESTVEKISRKGTQNQISNSQLTINNAFTFFLEHKEDKEYFRGGIGKIKKGYSANQIIDETPTYNVKKIDPKLKDANTLATRAVKINHLLDRQACYFQRKGSYRIVSSWVSGKALSDYKEDELKLIPIEKRFYCLISGLSDIEKLHSHFRIHGDIKPSNFVIDFNQSRMSIIDFDSTRKMGSSSTNSPYTLEYLSSYKNINKNQSFCDDAYAMGQTIKDLFPEIYSSKTESEPTLRVDFTK
ncbi:MAG: hypothetical protein HYX60_03245 [Legionella longbeachae]|nr:hypothetical protein [Legionella longbeachae]